MWSLLDLTSLSQESKIKITGIKTNPSFNNPTIFINNNNKKEWLGCHYDG